MSPSGAASMVMALVGCSAFSAGAQNYGLVQRPVVGPFLNGILPRKEQSSTGWAAVAAFPNISFDDPTCFAAEPRTNRLYVGGRQGKIYFFENDPGTTNRTLFLDLSAVTQGYNDCGLLGVAFHPEFNLPGSTNRGYVYVSYSYSPSPVVNPEVNAPGETLSYNRLSRFTVPDGAVVADPGSELVLINQFDPHVWHNGGGMFFGPDGFLYLSNGDSGGNNDPYNHTQEINGGLFSGVLRIDVDRIPGRSHPIRRQPQSDASLPVDWPPSYSQDYFIPDDNPWLDPGGSVLEEFYAIGFRSPHRMTYDPPTGRIWLGDVGQSSWEEVDVIEKGGNYQWAYLEGTHPGPKAPPATLIGEERPPVYDYAHSSGNNAVIGGYVYRGTEHAAYLSGQYIFGDNGSCRIWAMNYDGISTPQVNLLCVVPNGGTEQTGLSSFGEDQNGELYMCVMGAGTKIYKLARTGIEAAPPALLSQTGVFTNLATLAPDASLVPYTVNTPLWSDNAVKFRWMSVPNDGAPFTAAETIGFAPNGSWSFPTGTVFVKHFELPIDDTNPAVRKRLETRLLVMGTNGGVYGLTYKWRADNSDADLLAGSLSETNTIATTTGTRTQVWYYPSRQDCLICHNPNARFVLGARTCELNGDYTYPATGETDNQLRALNHIGMFNPPLDETNIAAYPRSAAITDTNATLEYRVRSYLDANCAQCHRPNGAPAFFDARLDTPLSGQGIVGGPVENSMGIVGAKVVAPGSPGQSLLYVRDNVVGLTQMPPLARNMVDTNYINVLSRWIKSLPPVLAPPIPLGNTNDGAQLDVVASSWINAARFQATATVGVATIFARVGAIAGHYQCAVYSDNGSQPSRFLRGSAAISSPGAGWQSFPLTTSLVVTNGQYYWLAIWSDDANARVYYSGTGGAIRWGSYPYGVWPDPVVTTGSASLTYCIYAAGVAPTLTSLAVTPASATIRKGSAQQFTAIGTYSDSSTLDLTGSATWISSNASVATIDGDGLATGVAAGTTTISAGLGSFSGIGTMTVEAVTLPMILSIHVSSDLVAITSSAIPGWSYVLEGVDDLKGTNWVELLPPVTASDSIVTVTNAVNGVGMRFYRLKQIAP